MGCVATYHSAPRPLRATKPASLSVIVTIQAYSSAHPVFLSLRPVSNFTGTAVLGRTDHYATAHSCPRPAIEGHGWSVIGKFLGHRVLQQSESFEQQSMVPLQ